MHNNFKHYKIASADKAYKALFNKQAADPGGSYGDINNRTNKGFFSSLWDWSDRLKNTLIYPFSGDDEDYFYENSPSAKALRNTTNTKGVKQSPTFKNIVNILQKAERAALMYDNAGLGDKGTDEFRKDIQNAYAELSQYLSDPNILDSMGPGERQELNQLFDAHKAFLHDHRVNYGAFNKEDSMNIDAIQANIKDRNRNDSTRVVSNQEAQDRIAQINADNSLTPEQKKYETAKVIAERDQSRMNEFMSRAGKLAVTNPSALQSDTIQQEYQALVNAARANALDNAKFIRFGMNNILTGENRQKLQNQVLNHHNQEFAYNPNLKGSLGVQQALRLRQAYRDFGLDASGRNTDINHIYEDDPNAQYNALHGMKYDGKLEGVWDNDKNTYTIRNVGGKSYGGEGESSYTVKFKPEEVSFLRSLKSIEERRAYLLAKAKEQNPNAFYNIKQHFGSSAEKLQQDRDRIAAAKSMNAATARKQQEFAKAPRLDHSKVQDVTK